MFFLYTLETNEDQEIGDAERRWKKGREVRGAEWGCRAARALVLAYISDAAEVHRLWVKKSYRCSKHRTFG